MRLPVTFYPGNGPNHIYLTSYKEWLAKQAITPNTLRAYYSRVKQFLFFLEYANLGDRCESDLSGMNDAIVLYLDFLRKSKETAKVTVNANINALNNFSQFLGLKALPLKRERCYAKPKRILTVDEQERFLHAIEQQGSARDRALALVLFCTGLRIGDFARLNIADISAGAACICLGSGTRLPLNKPTIIALRQWLEERSKLACAELDTGLWLTKDGQRLSISGITFVIKRIGWKARLIVSAELLRRTWLANGKDQLGRRELASRFGGYISSTTVNRYGISLPVESATPAFGHELFSIMP